MFTRCPQCETTFRLGAPDLRRAGGKVRCGECATVFNALEYLEEEAERLGPSHQAWQTEPANDEHSEPGDGIAGDGSDEVVTDTLYDDDHGVRLDETVDSQTDPVTGFVGEEVIADADTDASEEPEYETEDETDHDEIVSFVTPISSANDYPEVSDIVREAIGASQAEDSDRTDAPDDSLGHAGAAWSSDPNSPFDEEFDISAADDAANDTVEFIISDDQDDTEAEFISADDSSDSSAAIDNADQQHADAANDDIEDDAENDSYDFDDNIWERIPGVGSGEATTQDSWFVKPGMRQTEWGDHDEGGHEARQESAMLDESTDSEAMEAAGPTDENENERESDVDMDTLEFDAPADTWSNIFSRTSQTVLMPAPGGDTEPDAVTPDEQSSAEAEELAEWSRELNATNPLGEAWQPESETDTSGAAEADDWVTEAAENDASEPPLVADAEKDEWEDWITEQNEPSANAEARQDGSSTEARDDGSEGDAEAAEQTEYSSDAPQASGEPDVARALSDGDEDNRAMEPDEDSGQESDEDRDMESLTAAFSTGEYDEKKYDVQHIVLSHESETDNAGLTQAFAAADAEDIPPWQPDTIDTSPARNSHTALWLLGGVLVVATLVLQLIHYNRDELAGSIAWGDSVRGIYRGLGMELFPNWSLDDYEIRGSEAIAGESGPDIMDIRAQIAAIGDESTGLPHIRVVLRDRWSNPVAAKTLGPAEYATPDNLPPDAMLQPNQTLAAHVSIIDPGSGAQGFELELCLPRRHTGLECSGRPFE